MMISEQVLGNELDNALVASEELLTCIQNDDWENVNKLNNVRMKLIRMLSMCRKSEFCWQNFGDKFKKMKELDEQILQVSKQRYNALALQIRQTQVRKIGCAEYEQLKLNRES